jgi:hypothetical protein
MLAPGIEALLLVLRTASILRQAALLPLCASVPASDNYVD